MSYLGLATRPCEFLQGEWRNEDTVKMAAKEKNSGTTTGYEARWAHLEARARQPTIGQTVDRAMAAIEFGRRS